MNPEQPLSRPPELLAPAGGPAALRAAVANGADAVYLGLDRLNARRSAENFTLETLGEGCRFAHLNDTKVYLTANVLVRDDEMADALSLVDQAWARGVDAVIVQDLGLLWRIRALLPNVRVHASTQINAHNSATVAALAELGVSRVTLAREVSLDEISAMGENSAVELESFVHGALCMCYSGQCLLSSLIGARSANRGMCAQPCRLTYELLDAAGTLVDTPGAHLLSPKDLAGIALLPELVRSGISALKIEGRMKSPEYVALVTGVYRGALDRAIATAGDYEVREAEMRVLEEAFSRGFTAAYLEGDSGNAMMSYQRPNDRGLPVGRVLGVTGSHVTVALDVALESDDTVEFWTSRGRFAQRAGPLRYGGSEHSSAPAGMRTELTAEGVVRQGDRVFRIANASMLAAARRTFGEESTPRRSLAVSVRLVAGEPLAVGVRDDHGRQGWAAGPIAERARTKAVTVDEVVEHVGRLGGTPYEARSWDVELSPNVGIGFSLLHRVRREALQAYEEGVLEPWSGRHESLAAVGSVASRERPPGRRHKRSAGVSLVAVTDDAALSDALLEAGADAVHVSALELSGGSAASAGIVPVLPRIAHDTEYADLLDVARLTGRCVAGNLGFLDSAVKAGIAVEAHWGLNALNARTAEALQARGAGLVWLSPELSGNQLAHIARTTSVRVGCAVYGHQELMVTEHCIISAHGKCSQACASCARRRESYFLRDRKGYRFPVLTDRSGRSHVHNPMPLDLAPSLDSIVESGVASVRLDFVIESAEECVRVTRQVRSALDAALAGSPIAGPLVQPSTTGHYFRGVR